MNKLEEEKNNNARRAHKMPENGYIILEVVYEPILTSI